MHCPQHVCNFKVAESHCFLQTRIDASRKQGARATIASVQMIHFPGTLIQMRCAAKIIIKAKDKNKN